MDSLVLATPVQIGIFGSQSDTKGSDRASTGHGAWLPLPSWLHGIHWGTLADRVTAIPLALNFIASGECVCVAHSWTIGSGSIGPNALLAPMDQW